MQSPKKVLIVSFDLPRKGEASPSLAIASLIAYAKANKRYGNDFHIYHVSIDMLENHDKPLVYFMDKIFNPCMQYETIAIATYIWSEFIITELIRRLRAIGYNGKIVLGGYQITYGRERMLKREYPECDIFISGYGEKSLVESIFMERPRKAIQLKKQPNFSELVSPYLSGEINVMTGQDMVRLETKRGCPYVCSFCAHRDLTERKVRTIKMSRVIEELEYFYALKVKKINILDPVFNTGNEYLSLLEEMVRIGFSSIISLQARLEMIRGSKGRHFIELVEKMNVILEFGVQTIFKEELKTINRSSDLKHIRDILRSMNARSIDYETSLIYGLPNQTLDSFKRSVDFLLENGAKKIFAFPLMLLKGTELYEQKQKWNLEEKILGDFNIPAVVSGNTFSEEDWLKMNEIADNLGRGIFHSTCSP
uniref:Radical SAM superfamily enzyme YgiQ, UPF0313 family n=1 Tax=Candidatus Kentrum sp. TC TaxID=2126339 RepID=A0A450YR54_9GAMM|nr:MAG: Radical SAM superfamily enzyme YgiQ, UPF0313 family [Candidatus Kentron sp. TC]